MTTRTMPLRDESHAPMFDAKVVQVKTFVRRVVRLYTYQATATRWMDISFPDPRFEPIPSHLV
jgi:hypothetical protein